MRSCRRPSPRAPLPRRRSTLALVVLVALSSLLTACGAGPADHVRIGVVAPLSGPRAFLGQELVNGSTLAVEELNRDGGVLGKQVELVVVDDADLVELPGQLAELAEVLHVTAVIGPESPGVLLSERSPLTRRGIPTLLPTAFSGDLDLAGSFVARMVPSARDQAERLGAWLTGERDGSTVAVLMADAVEGTAPLADLRAGFEDAGAEVVAVVETDAEATTLDPAVATLRSRAPDADMVLLWGLPSATARATLAVRSLDWDVQVAVPASSFVAEYRTLIGRASEGVVLAFPYDPTWFNDPRLAGFLLRYYASFGLGALPQLQTLVLDVPVLAVAAYDAVGMVAAAATAADSPLAADVAQALGQVTHDGLLRDFSFAQREGWDADELYVARFHQLATIFDADGRQDPQEQRTFFDNQVNADYLPESVLNGPGGAAIQQLLDRGRAEIPDYRAPLPGPGPVARPSDPVTSNDGPATDGQSNDGPATDGPEGPDGGDPPSDAGDGTGGSGSTGSKQGTRTGAGGG